MTDSQLAWDWILDWDKKTPEERSHYLPKRFINWGGGVDITSIFNAYIPINSSVSYEPNTIIMHQDIFRYIYSHYDISLSSEEDDD